MSARLGWPQRLVVALMAGLAAGSCRSATSCAPPVPPVVLGSWSYKATQTNPSASLIGVLQVTSQCGEQFGGALNGTITDVGGQHAFTGTVSGDAVDTTADFDAFLSVDAAARRHVGILRNDTLSGQWFSVSGAGSPSGSFTAAWTSTP